MLRKLVGHDKLKYKEDFPVYKPDEDPESLPLVDGSDEVRQYRFNWEEDATDPQNEKGIQIAVKLARSHGVTYVSSAATQLPLVSFGDLENRFVTRWKAMQKDYRKVKPSAKGSDEEEEDDEKPMTSRTKKNRGRGVSGMQASQRSIATHT